MALPYEVNFTVLDGEGNRASGGFFIDSNQTVANAVTEAEGMLSDLQDDCLGKVESANLLVPIYVTGFITCPAADPANAFSGSHVLSDVALNPARVITDGIVARALTTSHDEPLTV